MPQHVGIVACSAEGAALCYRTICIEGAGFLGPHAHPEVSIHTPSLADYMQPIYRDDWQGVGELMLASANKLARMGADFLICPDGRPGPWCARDRPGRARDRPWRFRAARDVQSGRALYSAEALRAH